MPWVGGAIGAVGAGLGALGANREAKSSNRYFNNLYSPGNINNYAQQFNPWVWNAIQGKGQGMGGFQGDLYNLAQGKDISPYLLNRPVAQINQGYNNNLAQLQGMLGRSGMSGGLANAYGLANLSGRTNALGDLYNKYGQWREQQRRSDLDWLLGQIGGSQTRGMGLAQQLGAAHRQPTSGLTNIGRIFQGFAAGMGGGGIPGMGGGGMGYNASNFAGSPSFGDTSQFFNVNPSGNWYNPQQGGFSLMRQP